MHMNDVGISRNLRIDRQVAIDDPHLREIAPGTSSDKIRYAMAEFMQPTPKPEYDTFRPAVKRRGYDGIDGNTDVHGFPFVHSVADFNLQQ
jgi:hypothetical protein